MSIPRIHYAIRFSRRLNIFLGVLYAMKDERPAAIYTRVSTGMQAEEGASLDVQEELCIAEATRQGFPVPPENIYREEGESAKNNDRPELIRLLADMQAGKLRAVVFYNMDRLSRSVEHGPLILRAANEGRCDLYLQGSGKVDTASPEGEFMVNLLFALGQLERRKTGKRVRDVMYGMVQPTRAGIASAWMGGPVPYGYNRVYDADGIASMVIDIPAAAVLLRIFTLYVDSGMGVVKIAHALNADGIPSPRTGQTLNGKHVTWAWGSQTVLRLIASPIYAGIYQFGDAVGAWPYERIIPEDLHAAATRIYRSRAYRRGPNTLRAPWQRMVRCAICGASMFRYCQAAGRVYMACKHVAMPDPKPKGLFIPMRQMEAATAVLLDIVRTCQPAPSKPIADASNADTLLAAARQKLERHKRAWLEGDIEDAEWDAAKREFREKEAALAGSAAISGIDLPAARNLADAWDALAVGQRHAWLSRLCDRYIADYEHIGILLRDWGWRGWPRAVYVDRKTGAVARRDPR
jgi:DNA invertase Pin-like site-specific DNA recombinase